MRLYSTFTSSLHRWFIVCLVLIVCTGIPGWLAAALVTQEEVNSVRVYKQMAKSTVLVASAYVSSHHITQASGRGLGSGILIDEEGSIVTNAHVVEGAAKITVTLHDGTRLPAELIGSDQQTGRCQPYRSCPHSKIEGLAINNWEPETCSLRTTNPAA